MSAAGTGGETEQAVGRLVGSLCAITAQDGDAQSAMLASWISQVETLRDRVCTILHLYAFDLLPAAEMYFIFRGAF